MNYSVSKAVTWESFLNTTKYKAKNLTEIVSDVLSFF